MAKQINIDHLSLVPLFVQGYRGERALLSGTGFAVQKAGTPYLVTNWHVITGRDPATNRLATQTGEAPDTIAIWHHIKGRLGTWGRRFVPLVGVTGSLAWREHPRGKSIDVIALPLTVDEETQLYPIDLNLANTDLILTPSEPVSIIGFPFGLSSAGRFPIWKTGHVASDIDLDYDGLPVFLIDATTKPGMSGAPVIARRIGMRNTSTGLSIGGEANRFLGIYSGRIHAEADVGMVWKPEVLDELIR